MTNSLGYIVVHLVPDSPVAGPIFGTYLHGLALRVIDANAGSPTNPAYLSDPVYSSPLNWFSWPGIQGYISGTSVTGGRPVRFG